MTYDHVDRFVALASVGGGMLLAGGLNLIARDRGLGVRTAIAAGSSAAAAGVVAAWSESLELTALAGLALTLVLLPGVLRGGRWPAAAAAWVRRVFARPTARSGSLAAVGAAVLVCAAVAFVRDDDDRRDREFADVARGDAYSPPRRPDQRVVGVTDRGTRIELSLSAAPRAADVTRDRKAVALERVGLREAVIRRGPADERSNCFGWVFANDRYWLTDAAVDTILADNGYAVVADPRPGDLVVYRSAGTGLAAHAAVVRYATDGMPTLVEGRWGWMGVFLHPIDRSPYGTNYACYRSPRATHQLAVTESDVGAALTGAE